MGDNLTQEQRSYTMSRIRSKHTGPELSIRRLVHSRGLRYRMHVQSIPGTPDLVFAQAKTVVFVDGDFWHGWRFPKWKGTLAPYWQEKIERNRRRDLRTFRRLRRSGWLVVRIWEHEVKEDANACADRIEAIVRRRANLMRSLER